MKAVVPFVQQTLPNNCVSASLSMVTGIHIDQVTSEFNDVYHADVEINESTYLNSVGYPHTVLPGVFRTPTWGNIYLAVVPSLNIRGGTHEIVIHCTSDEEFLVLDPNKGLPDCYYYVNGPVEDELAFQITSYACVVEISETDFIAFTSKEPK